MIRSVHLMTTMWISIALVTLEIMSSTVDANSPAVYMGCYKDDPENRILTGHMNKNMNPNGALYCRHLCWTEGFRFAGTEYSEECFCGNSFKWIEKGLSCNYDCQGNPSERCGGSDRMSVYYTNLCDAEPCLNNGKCTDINAETYQCTCTKQWKGTNCEREITTTTTTTTSSTKTTTTTTTSLTSASTRTTEVSSSTATTEISTTVTSQNGTESIAEPSKHFSTKHLLVSIGGSVGALVVLCGLVLSLGLFMTYRRRRSAHAFRPTDRQGRSETNIEESVTYDNVSHGVIQAGSQRLESERFQTYEGITGQGCGTQNEYMCLRPVSSMILLKYTKT